MAAPSARMSARRVRSGSNIVQRAVLASEVRDFILGIARLRLRSPETSTPQAAFLQVYSAIQKKPWPKFRARSL